MKRNETLGCRVTGAEMIASVYGTKNSDFVEAARYSLFILTVAQRSRFEELIGKQLMSEEVLVQSQGWSVLAEMEPTEALDYCLSSLSKEQNVVVM